jgi:Tol biopolymer transport system component
MPWDSSRIVVRRVRSDGTPEGELEVVSPADDVQVQQPAFSPDGTALAFLCDANGWLNIWVADVADGLVKPPRPLVEEPFEHGGASWGMGQRTFAWSPDGRSVAFARNEGGFGRLLAVDVASGSVEELGKGVHGALSWVGDRIAALRSGARTPTSVVVYEGATRRVLARGPVGG